MSASAQRRVQHLRAVTRHAQLSRLTFIEYVTSEVFEDMMRAICAAFGARAMLLPMLYAARHADVTTTAFATRLRPPSCDISACCLRHACLRRFISCLMREGAADAFCYQLICLMLVTPCYFFAMRCRRLLAHA